MSQFDRVMCLPSPFINLPWHHENWKSWTSSMNSTWLCPHILRKFTKCGIKWNEMMWIGLFIYLVHEIPTPNLSKFLSLPQISILCFSILLKLLFFFCITALHFFLFKITLFWKLIHDFDNLVFRKLTGVFVSRVKIGWVRHPKLNLCLEQGSRNPWLSLASYIFSHVFE